MGAVKERATRAQPKMVQVKILKEDVGGRSKGIAFVEFAEHEHALCALRQLNNNPTTWGKDHRPIVEFAIDNVKALKIREARHLRQQQQAKGVGLGTSGGSLEGKSKEVQKDTVRGSVQGKGEGGEGEEKVKSKRKLRQERRLVLKQRQRQQQGETQVEDVHDESGTAATTVTAAAAAVAASKSRRRREQRKRQKDVENVPAAKEEVQEKNYDGHARKKRADDLLDLVASAGAGEGGAFKKMRSSTKGADRLDRLAAQHTAKFYGEARNMAKQTEKKGGSKRWFQD